MSDKPNKTTKFTTRRRLMKAMAGGTGAVTGIALLPEKWKRPIIESVYLPAHAMTTDDETAQPEEPTPTDPTTTAPPPDPVTTAPPPDPVTTAPPPGPTPTIP